MCCTYPVFFILVNNSNIFCHFSHFAFCLRILFIYIEWVILNLICTKLTTKNLCGLSSDLFSRTPNPVMIWQPTQKRVELPQIRFFLSNLKMYSELMFDIFLYMFSRLYFVMWLQRLKNLYCLKIYTL